MINHFLIFIINLLKHIIFFIKYVIEQNFIDKYYKHLKHK